MPFLAEKINLELFGGESIHLSEIPKPEKSDSSLELQMEAVKEIVETCNSIRKEENIKLKWPLRSVSVDSKDANVTKAVKTFESVILEMSNVSGVKKTAGYRKEFPRGVVHLSKEILEDEALLREFLRAVQERRKKEGMAVTDRIILHIDGDLKKFSKEIEEKVSAEKIVFKKLTEGDEAEFEGTKVRFSVEKVSP